MYGVLKNLRKKTVFSIARVWQETHFCNNYQGNTKMNYQI